MLKGRTLFLATTAMMVASPAFAQQVPPADPTAPAETQDQARDDVVVTAVAGQRNRLDTSISVSSLNAEAIANAAPRSAAELFRSLPGIRSESSGGEGNANIQVRGIPISTGGAKFLQLQEDGLPILEFGDIAFGNADIFLRADFNVARVEAVRGGSASTFASNSPGGVINLISKTGEGEGGSIQGTIGADYGEYRVDADYAAKISDSLSFHVGGFYRIGEGPRRAGYVIGALSRGFDGPIGIHTDVAGAALAEGSWGASVDCYTHAYITIGTGIGGGIVIGGRPYAGIHHPEIGHIRVRRAPSDRFAGICPFHGDCLEGLASGPAIAARAGQPAENLPADHPIWATVTAEIAEMLCSLILTISPERIVLGGGVGFGQAWLLPRLRHATACLLNNYLPGHTEESLKGVIVPPSLGADAGVYGGVALAITALTKGL